MLELRRGQVCSGLANAGHLLDTLDTFLFRPIRHLAAGANQQNGITIRLRLILGAACHGKEKVRAQAHTQDRLYCL